MLGTGAFVLKKKKRPEVGRLQVLGMYVLGRPEEGRGYRLSAALYSSHQVRTSL